MTCKLCGSANQDTFVAEMGIHAPKLKNIDEPVAWVFPEVMVCLDCGFAEFIVPASEVRLLTEGKCPPAEILCADAVEDIQ
jgi:hypothetical protein